MAPESQIKERSYQMANNKKPEYTNTPVDWPVAWSMYPIDDYPNVYKNQTAHKKVKAIYESLTKEEKGKCTSNWFNEQFTKVSK